MVAADLETEIDQLKKHSVKEGRTTRSSGCGGEKKGGGRGCQRHKRIQASAYANHENTTKKRKG